MSHSPSTDDILTNTARVKQSLCTASRSNQRINQPIFICFTCDQSTINPQPCCEQCAIHCHAGHDTRATVVREETCKCTHQPVDTSTHQSTNHPTIISPFSIRSSSNQSINQQDDDEYKHDESKQGSGSPSPFATDQSINGPSRSSSPSGEQSTNPSTNQSKQSNKSTNHPSVRSTKRSSGSSIRDLFSSILAPIERPMYRSSPSRSINKSANQSPVSQPINQSFVCTFKLYGPRFIPQRLFECLDCSFTSGRCICESCVVRCHANHRVRRSPIQQPAFCDCGESARRTRINQRPGSRPFHQCHAMHSASPSQAVRLSVLCSLRRTGPYRGTQSMWMCSTCNVLICANCARLCHGDHSSQHANQSNHTIIDMGVVHDTYCMCGSGCVALNLDDPSRDGQLTNTQTNLLRIQQSHSSPHTEQSTNQSSQSRSSSSSADIDVQHDRSSSFHDWSEPEKPVRQSTADSDGPIVMISAMSIADHVDFANPNSALDWGPEPMKPQPIDSSTNQSINVQLDQSGPSSPSPVPSQPSPGPVIMLSPPAFDRAITAPEYDESSPLDFSPVLPQRIQTEPARASSSFMPQSLGGMLNRLGLGEYLTVFNEHDHDLESLTRLDDHAWQLFVPVHGHRVRIVNALKDIFAPSQSASLGVYRTVVADMYATQHINSRDLTLLARLRTQYNISLSEHMQILDEIGITDMDWERVVTLTSIAEAQTSNQSNNQSECCVCYSEIATFIILPCGHLCLCRDCESRIMRGSPCPKCRAVVIATQRIWT